MSDRIYERFSGMLNTSDSPPCHVIGVGAVGRPLALMLARAGARVNVYDDDTVDWPNVGTQGYHADDVGKPKVHALMDEMKRMLPPEKHTFRGYQQRVEEVTFSNWSHVFLCVDSMETRAQLTENKASVHYYDVRCGSRVGNLQYYMNRRVIPKDLETYEKYKSSLFDDSESSPLRVACRLCRMCLSLLRHLRSTCTAMFTWAGGRDTSVKSSTCSMVSSTTTTSGQHPVLPNQLVFDWYDET